MLGHLPARADSPGRIRQRRDFARPLETIWIPPSKRQTEGFVILIEFGCDSQLIAEIT
jgi:hypothetical protein